jgi:choline monooxygenase
MSVSEINNHFPSLPKIPPIEFFHPINSHIPKISLFLPKITTMKTCFVDPDITKARTIHTDFYTDSEVFEQSKRSIFRTSWHYVGDTELLPENGSVYPFILLPGFLDEPLFLLRDHHGAIKCFSNVCTHRGNLIVTQSGKLGKLRCGYHGRTFDQAGKMIFMPEFDGVIDFPCAADHLHEFPVFQWGGMLFLSLNKDSNPSAFFCEMMERMSFFPMDKLVRRDDLSKDYHIRAHWALYCENYLEGFHIPFVHSGLSQALDFPDYDTEIFYPNACLQLGIGRREEDCFVLPADAEDFGKKMAAYYFWVFPNLMFNFYPWGLSLNVVQPISKRETRVSFISYMYDESRYNKGAGSDLDRVELEDEAIVENVQRGVRSSFYTQGRYSPRHERCTHHFHRLLAERFGEVLI